MKKGKLIFYIVIAALAVFVCACLIEIILYTDDMDSSEDEYRNLADKYVTEDRQSGGGDEDQGNHEKKLTHVDFDSLQGINTDIKAWIRFDHTGDVSVDYPVLQAADDQKYIHTDIYGSESRSGSLFLEAVNSGNFNDPNDMNQIIYGHNMRNGSMFGTLKRYRSEDFYKKNDLFSIFTPEKVYRYKIFSCFKTPDDSFIYNTGFRYGSDEYREYLERIADMSVYKSRLVPSASQNIVLLSTCIGDGDNRFVVCGMLTSSRNN